MSGAARPPLLSSEHGRRALDALLAAPALLAFDFDGTLAPIVNDPQAAAVPEPLARTLGRLCALAPVAVVTGRSVADVAARLAFAPRHVVGNHGMEGLPGVSPRQAADEAAVAIEACRGWTAQLAGLDLPAGVLVEDKALSLSVHWRNAADADAAQAAVEAAVARLSPAPKRIAGKFVVNLLPPGASTKGEAIGRLLAHERLRGALFAGDDETDEIAFAQAPPEWLTVRIGPFERTAARFCLPDQAAMGELLHAVESRLAAGPWGAVRHLG